MSSAPVFEDGLPAYSPPPSPPSPPRHDLSSCDSYFSCTRSTSHDAWASHERPSSRDDGPASFGLFLGLVAIALLCWASLILWKR